MKIALVHGMFCGPACWDPLVRLLTPPGAIDVRRVQLHPPGLPRRGRGFAAVTEAARLQLRDLSHERFVLVGHSMGALVVQKLLPEFPLALPVLVNPSPGWGSPGPPFALWMAASRGFFWRDEFRLSASERRRLLFQGLSEDEFARVQVWVEPESGELVRQAFWFFDLLGAATRLNRMPTRDVTVLTGEIDPLATPAHGRQLVSRHGPGSTLKVLPGVGHMAMLQQAGTQALAQEVLSLWGAATRAAAERGG